MLTSYNALFAQSVGRLDSMRLTLKDSTPETAIKIYYQIADRYFVKHQLIDSQYVNIERGIAIAMSTGNKKQFGYGMLDMGYYYINLKEYNKADSLLDVGLKLFKTAEDKKSIGMMMLAKGKVASKRKNVDQFIDYTLQAKEQFEAVNDTRGVISCLTNVGVAYTRVKQYRKALGYIKQAYLLKEHLTVSQYANVVHSLALTHWNIYEETQDESQLDSAMYYVDVGTKHSNEKNILYYQIKFKRLQIEYDKVNEKYGAIIPKCKELIEKGRAIKSDKIICESYMGLVDAYQGLGQYNKSLGYIDSILYYARSLESDLYISGALERKYNVYKASGNYKKALENYQQFTLINDTLARTERVAKLKEIETKYETAKKEKEILVLNQEAQSLKQAALLKQEELKSKNYLLFALVILALSAIALFMFFSRQKIQKEKKKSEEIKQQLWRSQMNPHFLFNALNSIQRFYIEGKTDEANDFLADFGDLLRKIIDRSSHPTVSVSEEIEFLKLYIDLERRRMGRPLTYTINLSEELKEYECRIPSLLLQPIVENAIRHGIMKTDKDGVIDISIVKEEDILNCKITDNGIGYDTQLRKKGSHRSMGLKLIKERLGELGGLAIKTLKNEHGSILGTEVNVAIKIQ